jgi:hypothetical protein
VGVELHKRQGAVDGGRCPELRQRDRVVSPSTTGTTLAPCMGSRPYAIRS